MPYMPSDHQPPSSRLKQNSIAACGSGLVAALVTNPLDVVKTRMQVEAASAAAQKVSGNWTACSYYARLPVRSASSRTSPTPYSDFKQALTKSLRARLSPASSSSLADAHASMGSSWWEASPRLAGAGAGGCGCAEAVAMGEAVPLAGSGFPPPGGCSARAPTFQQHGMLATFKNIIQQEGLASLWRGLDSALMLTVPQVLLYYPLYDALMAQAHRQQSRASSSVNSSRSSTSEHGLGANTSSQESSSPGFLTPMACGAAARTVAVFAVAPLELARTRQQALHRAPSSSTPSTEERSTSHMHASTSRPSATSAVGSLGHTMGAHSLGSRAGGGGGSHIPGAATTAPSSLHPQHAYMNTWGALKSGLGIDAATSTGSSSSSVHAPEYEQGLARGSRVPAATVVRSLPRLWTGFSATVARDVPFSALYWGLLEPTRAALLAYSSVGSSSSSSSQNQPGSPPSSRSQERAQQLEQLRESKASSLDAWAGCELEWLMLDAAAGSMAPLSPCTQGGLCDGVGRSGGGQGSQFGSSTSGGGQQGGDSGHNTASYSVTNSGSREDSSSSSSSSSSSALSTQGSPGGVARSSTQLLWVNLAAGSSSGALAAAATTPFDVIKTRMQTATRNPRHAGEGSAALTPMGVMRQVYREAGVSGLFVGLGPRAVRCAPACAIVVACYELLKSWL